MCLTDQTMGCPFILSCTYYSACTLNKSLSSDALFEQLLLLIKFSSLLDMCSILPPPSQIHYFFFFFWKWENVTQLC